MIFIKNRCLLILSVISFFTYSCSDDDTTDNELLSEEPQEETAPNLVNDDIEINSTLFECIYI